MYKQGVPGFKYYVGIDTLAKVATREDRVCVLNILGGESSDVTPVSHAFSGGNVVFGTSPGRGGQKLKTPIGDVPVFNSVREGLERRPPLQHRRGLPAALGGARRRGRAGPGQPRPREDHHHHREGLGPRCARDPRHRPDQRRSTSSAATAWGWRMPGTGCGSAARSAATTPARPCSRARSRSSPTPATSPPRSPTIWRPTGWGTTTLDLERQGRLHPLRRARVHPCLRQ